MPRVASVTLCTEARKGIVSKQRGAFFFLVFVLQNYLMSFQYDAKGVVVFCFRQEE